MGMHIVEGFGFFVMILAPCAIALSGRRAEKLERDKELATAAEVQSGVAAPVAVQPAPARKTFASTRAAARAVEVAAETLPQQVVVTALPTLVPASRQAALQALQAQAEAARLRAAALGEVSRAAAHRVKLADTLAEAAGEELERARQAVATRKQPGTPAADGGRAYLAPNHPSLDFPRAPVSTRRAA